MKTTAELLSLYAVIDSAEEAVDRVHASAQAAADRWVDSQHRMRREVFLHFRVGSQRLLCVCIVGGAYIYNSNVFDCAQTFVNGASARRDCAQTFVKRC